MRTVVIDIETTPNQSELKYEESLLRAPKTYKDPEKIRAYIGKQKLALKEKMALQDSANISMIGVLVEGKLYSFCSFPAPEMPEIKTFAAGSEAEMMEQFGKFLETLDQSDILVSHNGHYFDLPKIRLGFAKNDMPVPEAMENEHIDIMFEFTRKFSVSRSPYIKLTEICHRLNIPEKGIGGEEYPKMIQRKEYAWAILYNALDLVKTYMAFMKITR